MYISYEEFNKAYNQKNNLLARLKPQFHKQLNNSLDEYPVSTKALIEALETTDLIGNLQYKFVLDLAIFVNADLSNPYAVFNEPEGYTSFCDKYEAAKKNNK